ncbi:MAG: hypothetical protein K5651_08800, partial [Bacteroidales bacterium]|nr:hypothetical protein [Bacteroidales bacterium]
WRVPTREQFELLTNTNNCSYQWTIYEGIKGLLFRGKGDYQDAFLFLPSAGTAQDSAISAATYQKFSAYWSSDLVVANNTYYGAHALFFEYGSRSGGTHSRFCGMPIRPVLVIPE